MAALLEKAAFLMIQLCADYRTLRGKRDDLRVALSPGDEARLGQIERFFDDPYGGPAGAPEFARRAQQRCAVRVPATFDDADGSPCEGLVRDVSGTGALVEARAPLAVGARTVLRVLDAASGSEWRFWAEVAWSAEGGRMGLRFLGIPLALRVGRPAVHRRESARRAA